MYNTKNSSQNTSKRPGPRPLGPPWDPLRGSAFCIQVLPSTLLPADLLLISAHIGLCPSTGFIVPVSAVGVCPISSWLICCSGLFCLLAFVVRRLYLLSVCLPQLVLLSVFVDRRLVSAYISLSIYCQWVFVC